MDVVSTLLYGISGFVLICCVCSCFQAYNDRRQDVEFDNLHSKYSRENIERIKDKRKRTAQEILELQEEIKIAEERLLAEHQYEQQLLHRLKEKEGKNTLTNRKKRKHNHLYNKKKLNYRNYDDGASSDSESDIEELIRKSKRDKHDVERGRRKLRRRAPRHRRKLESLLDKTFDTFKAWVSSEPTKPGQGPQKSAGFTIPKLDWAPFRPRSKRVGPASARYAPDSTEQSESSYDYEHTIEKRISLSPDPEMGIRRSGRDITLSVKASPLPELKKVEPIKTTNINKCVERTPKKSLGEAWTSPVSQGSCDSEELPISSLPGSEKRTAWKNDGLRLSPLDTPSPKKAFSFQKYGNETTREFNDEFDALQSFADDGLLYQSPAPDIFEDDIEEYSDL